MAVRTAWVGAGGRVRTGPPAAALDIRRPIAHGEQRIEVRAGAALLAHAVAVHAVEEGGAVVDDRLEAVRPATRLVAAGVRLQARAAVVAGAALALAIVGRVVGL